MTIQKLVELRETLISAKAVEDCYTWKQIPHDRQEPRIPTSDLGTPWRCSLRVLAFCTCNRDRHLVLRTKPADALGHRPTSSCSGASIVLPDYMDRMDNGCHASSTYIIQEIPW